MSSITDNMLVNTSMRYMRINTTAKGRTATVRTNAKVDVNPVVYTLTLGYRL